MSPTQRRVARSIQLLSRSNCDRNGSELDSLLPSNRRLREMVDSASSKRSVHNLPPQKRICQGYNKKCRMAYIPVNLQTGRKNPSAQCENPQGARIGADGCIPLVRSVVTKRLRRARGRMSQAGSGQPGDEIGPQRGIVVPLQKLRRVARWRFGLELAMANRFPLVPSQAV